MRYYVDMDTLIVCTDTGDGDESDRWAWQGGSECIDSTIKGIYYKRPESLPMGWIEVHDGRNGATYGVGHILPRYDAYVLVVRYIDGDTFGYNGYADISGIFSTYETAKTAETLACDPDDGKFCGPVSRPWDGFFARLTGTDIHVVEVQP
jgi:hypothetical protein